jgi:tape measure domain-containing protein
MTTENVVIVVSQRGAKTVSRDINEIGTSSSKSSKSVNLLKSALAALGGAMVVSQLAEWADGWTRVVNRVALTTDGLKAQIATQEQLYAVSQRSRQGLEGMSQLYLKASTAARDLGASQETIMKFTEGVGQALSIQGTSTEAATGALLQLGQALGSARVMADEYNGILEGGYVIAQTVANNIDAAGGSVNRLTRIIKGDAGISGKQFFDAFMKGAKDLEKTFAKMVPTIGQSLTVLGNSMTKLIGQEGRTVSEAAALGIIYLAEAIDTLSGAITVATKLSMAFIAGWAAFKVGTIVSGMLSAAAATIRFSSAVADGTVVALGSAEANRMKAVSAQQAAVADAAATGSALRKAVAEENAARMALASVGAVQAQMVAERQLEVVRLQAQITAQGRAASLTRLGEIRLAEAAMTTQQTAAELRLTEATLAATAADTARAAALGRVAVAQGVVGATTVAAAGSTTRLAQALNGLKTMLGAAGLGFLANPFVAAVAAIVAASVALYAFRDDLILVKEDSISLGDYFRATWELLGELVNDGVEYLKTFGPMLDKVGAWFLGLGIDMKSVIGFMRTTVNTVIGLWVGAAKAVIAFWGHLPAALEDIGTQGVNKIRAAMNMDPLQNDAEGAAKGLGSAVVTGFKDGLGTDYVGAVITPILDGFDALTERARKFAKERALEDGKPPVPKPLPPEEAGGEDKKKAKERAKLIDDLNRILDIVDPVGAAMRELADAEVTLNKAMAAGLISSDQKTKVMAAYREHLAEALDPLGHLNKELERETKLIMLSNGAREVAQQLYRIEDSLRDKGVKLTKEQSAALEKQISTMQSLEMQSRALQSVRDDTVGSLQEILLKQQALNTAMNLGMITEEYYRNQIAQTNVAWAERKNAMGEGTDFTIFTAGIGQVLEGYTTLATGAADIIGNVFTTMTDGISNSIASAIMSGDDLRTSLHKISQTILTDMISALVKLGIQYVVNAALGNSLAATGTAASIAMAGTVAAAWAPAASAVSLASWGANSPAAIAGMAASSAAAASMAALPGFKTGGDFTVGGVGGPDSRLVQFKATPGERVSIETPAQQRRNGGNGGGSVVHMTVYANDADSFQRSEGQIAARTSQAIDRANKRNN